MKVALLPRGLGLLGDMERHDRGDAPAVTGHVGDDISGCRRVQDVGEPRTDLAGTQLLMRHVFSKPVFSSARTYRHRVVQFCTIMLYGSDTTAGQNLPGRSTK